MTFSKGTPPAKLSLKHSAVILTAIAQVLAPGFSAWTHIGSPIDKLASTTPGTSPENPASYAFMIWFVIFILSLLYGLLQALPAHRKNMPLQIMGRSMVGLFFLSTLWMLIAQIWGDVWCLAVIITAMLGLALGAFLKWISDVPSPQGVEKWIISPMLGLYSGWLTLATFLNIASVLKMQTLAMFHISVTLYAVLTLLLAVSLALYVIRRSSYNGWYAGTILWGLIAIMVTNISPPHNDTVAAFVGGCMLIVVFQVVQAVVRVRHSRSKLG